MIEITCWYYFFIAAGMEGTMEEKKEVLEKLYDDFLKEKESIQEKINECNNKISEVSSYIDNITSIEDSDFKFFSPRNVETIYKDSLTENRNLKVLYEEECKSYIRKKEIIESRLKKIEFLLVNPNNDLYELEIQETERRRIARDLHDSSLQNLTHTIHEIELASKYIDKDPIQAKLELASISKNIREVINEIRSTIFDLRPMQFDDLGFKESVEELVTRLKNESSINIIFDIDDLDLNNKAALMAIFRIVQECMNNAVKHSDGSLVNVKIKDYGTTFHIEISDDGKGFEVDKVLQNEKLNRHFGLMILEERVNILHGTIDFKSEKDKGTNIKIQLPLDYLKGNSQID